MFRTLAFLVVLGVGLVAQAPEPRLSAAPAVAVPASRPAAPTALILYDDTGPWGDLGELYAIFTGNLVGHFGSYEAKPVRRYVAGDIEHHTATIFIGSTFEERLSQDFLNEVAATRRPVLWMQYGIDQLIRKTPNFVAERGWTTVAYDPPGSVTEVIYKGTSLTRQATSDGGVTSVSISDPTKARVIAQAVRAGGRSVPWAIRSGNLTYIGENPYNYMTENDRYIALADIMFDLMAPKTPERHRALVRIEDVSPISDPAKLRAIADYLASEGVPFSVALIDTYVDPLGVERGKPRRITLAQSPKLVEALKYMQTRGGTLIMHGHTHQFERLRNPYDGITGNDFEFYRAHVNKENYVHYDGPVPGDSTPWARARIDKGIEVWKAAGLAAPTIFEFPHYAASAADYAAVDQKFGLRYERAIYFRGTLAGRPDPGRQDGQFFPYPLRDVYGSWVIPENLGNVELVGYNHNTSRTAAQIVATAKRNLAVRDGFASFFFHAYLGPAQLKLIVPQIKGLGYQFVAPDSLLAEATERPSRPVPVSVP